MFVEPLSFVRDSVTALLIFTNNYTPQVQARTQTGIVWFCLPSKAAVRSLSIYDMEKAQTSTFQGL